MDLRKRKLIHMEVALIKWDTSLKDDLIRICNSVDRSYLSERIPDPYTTEDADWWLDMVEAHDGEDGIFRAVVFDGRIIGSISVEQKSDVRRKDAELGYMLLTDYWSKGVMTEAVRQICEIAFDELDLIRISALVYSPNVASQRVLEKNDFECEGRLRNAIYKNGNVYDAYIYGKIK